MDTEAQNTAKAGSNPSMIALQDAASNSTPGGKRLHPRVSRSLMIRLGDETYRIADWSMGGFTIVPGSVPIQEGDVARAEVRLTTFHDLTISFDTPCQMVRRTEDGLIAFRFLSLDKEHAALLYRVVEDHLAGQEPAIASVIALTDLQPGLLHTPPQRRPLRAVVRRVATIALLLTIAVVLSTLVASYGLTVRSQIAAVAMDGTILRAPLTGMLQGSDLRLGTHVATGQVLFRVGTPDEVRQSAAVAAQLARQQLALVEQKVRLGNVRGLAGNLAVFAEANAASAHAQVVAMDAQLAAARAILNRNQVLAGQGFASQQQIDTQQIQVQQLEALRQAAEAAQSVALRDVELAKTGSLRTDLPDNIMTQDAMVVRVAEAAEAVKAATAAVAALEHSAEVLSPCDCIVHAIAARPGDVVQAGTLIYALRPQSGAPVIDALFAPQRAQELAIGARASIALPDRVIAGRLLRITYDEPQTGRLGLPPTSGTIGNLAKATIEPDQALEPAIIGTPATVVIWGNPLRGIVARFLALISA